MARCSLTTLVILSASSGLFQVPSNNTTRRFTTLLPRRPLRADYHSARCVPAAPAIARTAAASIDRLFQPLGIGAIVLRAVDGALAQRGDHLARARQLGASDLRFRTP